VALNFLDSTPKQQTSIQYVGCESYDIRWVGKILKHLQHNWKQYLNILTGFPSSVPDCHLWHLMLYDLSSFRMQQLRHSVDPADCGHDWRQETHADLKTTMFFWVFAPCTLILDKDILEKDTISIFRCQVRTVVFVAVRIMTFFWPSAPCRYVDKCQHFRETHYPFSELKIELVQDSKILAPTDIHTYTLPKPRSTSSSFSAPLKAKI
jgi:hypothetical protein